MAARPTPGSDIGASQFGKPKTTSVFPSATSLHGTTSLKGRCVQKPGAPRITAMDVELAEGVWLGQRTEESHLKNNKEVR
jgi:hypothetical protein